ncbi:MAG: hypothetical protein R6U65_04145 [Perlabentimonas sp.]
MLNRVVLARIRAIWLMINMVLTYIPSAIDALQRIEQISTNENSSKAT